MEVEKRWISEIYFLREIHTHTHSSTHVGHTPTRDVHPAFISRDNEV